MCLVGYAMIRIWEERKRKVPGECWECGTGGVPWEEMSLQLTTRGTPVAPFSTISRLPLPILLTYRSGSGPNIVHGKTQLASEKGHPSSLFIWCHALD